MRYLLCMRSPSSVAILLLIASPALGAPARISGQNATERFHRSIEADIAIAEAENQAKSNPKGARQLLAYARDVAQEDPEVWYQSARFEVGQGNKEAALKHLNQTLKLDATHTLAAYDRAVLLVDLGKEDDAKAALKTYQQSHPDDARPAYYLGLYAFAAGDNITAKKLFDSARVGDGQVAAYARSYFALLAAADKDPESPRYAAEALKTAPNETFRQKLQPIASLYAGGDAAASGERTQSLFALRAYVGSELDSNAALAPLRAAQIDAAIPAQSTRPIIGFRLVEDLRVAVRPVAKDAFTLEFEGAFSNANHLNRRSELATYDYASPAGTLRMSSRLGGKLKVELGLDASYRALLTNAFRVFFFYGVSASPYVGLLFGQRHALYALGTVEYRDYRSSTVTIDRDSQYERDGMVFSGGLYYTVPFWWFDASLAGGYDQENARGTEYFLRGARGQAQVRFNYAQKVIVNAYAGGNFRWFPRALGVGDLATPSGRMEQRFEFGGGVRWNIVEYFAVAASYAFTMNDAFTLSRAPYDLYTYRRHVASLSVIGMY